METPDADALFGGPIPDIYDTLLVPMIFEPYALDLASRVAARRPKRVLEIAAGTGVVTRALVAALPDETAIVATDLSAAMLQRAAVVGTRRPVAWQQADALQLPFEDDSFDVVVVQFGVMFFSDKTRAFAEARRVLVSGGTLLFNVWDRVEENEFVGVVTAALDQMFPSDPTNFIRRTPHGYHEQDAIEADLRRAGFAKKPAFETVALRSRAVSPWLAAVAYCQGTPLRDEIETRDPDGLAKATDACADEIGKRFGSGSVEGKIQAHVITVEA